MHPPDTLVAEPPDPPSAPTPPPPERPNPPGSPAGASGPPGRPAPPARPPLFARPGRAIGLLVVGVAVAFDLAAHQPVASLATTFFVAVAVVALVVGGRVRRGPALLLGLAAVVVATFLSLRASPWLISLDLVAAVGLLAMTSAYGPSGSVAGLTGAALARRAGRFLVSILLAPSHALACAAAWIPARREQRRRQLVAVARGIGLALPVVVLLAALLASADVVFASLFSVPDDLSGVVWHVVLVGVGIIGASALFVEVAGPEIEDRPLAGSLIGPTESCVVLGSITSLYLVFAGVQVVAGRGGAAAVMETAGLTYADHAREGFFQLLAVAALTLVVVCGLRVATRRGSRRQRLAVALLSEAVVLLTLVIVGVALSRLGLYEDAYGATMLRLASVSFAWWLGVVFVLVGLAVAGVGHHRTWLTAAVALSAFVALIGWNVVNPERVVVERNLAQARAGERELDTAYVWSLSDDAVPALAAGLSDLDEGDRVAVLARICDLERPPGPNRRSLRSDSSPAVAAPSPSAVRDGGAGAPGGPEAPRGLAANRSAIQAADVRREVCR